MRQIAKNNIVAISASSEDPNFPVSMVLDNHPKRKYKALSMVPVSTLVFDVVGGCSDIIVAGTNAAIAEVSVEDPNITEWLDADWGDVPTSEVGDPEYIVDGSDFIVDGSDFLADYAAVLGPCSEWASEEINISVTVIQRSKSNSLFITLSQDIAVPCRCSMVLRGSGTLEAGIISSNKSETYGGEDPNYGVTVSRNDYSIRDTNSNGSGYYYKRDIVRVFDINAQFTRDNSFLLLDNFDEVGENPTGWKLTDLTGNEWVVFGKFDGPPSISHDGPNHSNVSFRIVEVL